jgi:hypothetical protein
VLHENNAKKEDLKARAVALKFSENISGMLLELFLAYLYGCVTFLVCQYIYDFQIKCFLIWNTNRGKESYCQGHQKRRYSTMTAAQMKVQMMMWLERCRIGLLPLIMQVLNYY